MAVVFDYPYTVCLFFSLGKQAYLSSLRSVSERAKRAEKASCGETVVQKGVFGESVSSLPPLRLALKTPENPQDAEERTLQKHPFGRSFLENGPNTVSESTVSNTELSEFSGLTEFQGENSLSSSQPIICVPKRTHRVFRRTHRVCRKTQ